MRPRLPLHNDFFLDTRQKGERKVVNPAWKPKDGKNPLRIEIADMNDLELVANFFNHHFIKNNNLRKALGATYEEMEEFSYDRAALGLGNPQSHIVFDGNKLVAVVLRKLYTPEEYYKLFNGELFHKNPKFLNKENYAEDIKARGFSQNASRIAVINEACISQAGKSLPPNVENLRFAIAAGVHPNYTRNGLSQYLTYEAVKTLKYFKCNYSMSIAVADASFEVAKKIGMKPLFCFPYKDYKENGKPVFKDIPEKCCYVMLGKNKDMLRLMEEKTDKQKSIYKSNL
uniref:N-acetyltransferase domain-containing protein n=1 Tax=Panagrolaimus davidi TaxID=227884 RepID=A0A914PKN5_9BILA